MKKNLLLALAILFSANFLMAQSAPAACSEIFISEYLEGANNNKALEFYNPTASDISLDNYTLGSNYNGTAFWSIMKFPQGAVVKARKTYVVVLDKRDTSKVNVSLEYPIYDGFQVWDTCKDRTTGQVIKDSTGKVVFCIQFDQFGTTFLPRRGKKYNDFLDLQCRASSFVTPVFSNQQRTMYYNGNDAQALFKGAQPDTVNMTNVVDMVGVYNDLGMLSTDGWKDWRGRDLTKDRNLVRKREVKNGTGLQAYVKNDTFRYNDWLSFSDLSFQNFGSHTCDCDAQAPVSGRRTCTGELVASSNDLPPAQFKIYPNPSVSGNISIDAEQPVTDITVFNFVGQVVDYQKISIFSESVQLTLNNVQTGLYFVKIKTMDNRTGVKKLFIK
jgi:Secretion system C-terminal sorting domain/Lamin Tail Domain